MDSSIKNSHLNDALKDLNQALEEWDKITSKPAPEQDLSPEPFEQETKELLLKLQEQIKDLSQG